MKLFVVCSVVSLFSNTITAQNDSLTAKSAGNALQINNNNCKADTSNPEAFSQNASISLPAYFILLGDDLKQDVTAPFHLTQQQLLQTGIYAGSIVALQNCSEYFEEPVQRFAMRLHDNSRAVSGISNFVTRFGGRYEVYALAAIGGYGFIFRDQKLKTTTLLATQAYITSGLIETGIKYLSGRQRPSYHDPGHIEPEPAFRGPGFVGNHHINSSFPSGHTTVAFAVATVFAKEYKNTLWVPATAYSIASLIGLSRLTQNAHWATDVIAGATLGYLCGSQVVKNYHHYAARQPLQNRGSLSFNLNYNGYNLEPGLLYTFRK